MSQYKQKIKTELTEQNPREIYSTSEIFTRPSGQKFAVFPTGHGNHRGADMAFDLIRRKYPKKWDSWDQHENTPGDGFFPVKYNNKYWLLYNEYEAKILCFSIFTMHRCGKTERVYRPLWINTGWLQRRELDLSNHEIYNIISNELENGFTTTPTAAL